MSEAAQTVIKGASLAITAINSAMAVQRAYNEYVADVLIARERRAAAGQELTWQDLQAAAVKRDAKLKSNRAILEEAEAARLASM